MIKPNVFDVLVVYTDGVATSVARAKAADKKPFSALSGCLNYNDAYGAFLETCEEFGLRAAFTTSGDIIGPGLCSSYWRHDKDTWKKVNRNGYSRQIFDKFSPVTEKKRDERELLFSDSRVVPFNNAFLLGLFFDKLATFNRLQRFAIPTVAVKNVSLQSVTKAVASLKKLTKAGIERGDFTRAIIVKDRFGAGGNFVFKVNKDFEQSIYALLQTYPTVAFVLQPFLQFKQGFTYKKTAAATDIRLIYQNDEIIQTYVRMAKENDFRCNEHQGATLIYVELDDIPAEVIALADDIAQNLAQHNSLFSLDFVVSDKGRVYFLEGNIGPGLDWNAKRAINKQKSVELIREIVGELAARKLRFEGAETIGFEDSVMTPTQMPAYLSEI